MIGKSMMLLMTHQFGFLLLDHMLEVNIDLDTMELVVGLAFTLEFTRLLHLESPGVSVQLDLVDLVSGGDLSHVATILGAGSILDDTRAVVSKAGRLGFWHNSVSPLESLLSLGGSAVSLEPLLFEFVKDGLRAHRVDLSLFLSIFEFGLLSGPLYFIGVSRNLLKWWHVA